MENALRNYIEEQFAGSPPSRANAELKEELYQNLIERYRDLINEGKETQAAYNIAVASLGNISPLISGPSEAQLEAVQAHRRRSAIITAIAVMLFILCPVPLIVLGAAGMEILGLTLLFVFVALGTGLLIFNGMSKNETADTENDTTLGEFRTWQQENSESRRKMKALSQALWGLTTVIYLAVSFLSGAWHITWIIFLIAGALEAVLKAVLELRK
jgi:hypothetical protein